MQLHNSFGPLSVPTSQPCIGSWTATTNSSLSWSPASVTMYSWVRDLRSQGETSCSTWRKQAVSQISTRFAMLSTMIKLSISSLIVRPFSDGTWLEQRIKGGKSPILTRTGKRKEFFCRHVDWSCRFYTIVSIVCARKDTVFYSKQEGDGTFTRGATDPAIFFWEYLPMVFGPLPNSISLLDCADQIHFNIFVCPY